MLYINILIYKFQHMHTTKQTIKNQRIIDIFLNQFNLLINFNRTCIENLISYILRL